ncbi:MAG: helix-hairpin-helix domain-containing protein [Bacteroidales bacterium]
MVFRKFLKQWFGYTRGERAGSFILLIILLVVLAIRALNSGSIFSGRAEEEAGLNPADSATSALTAAARPAGVFSKTDSTASLYTFDPNTASEDKLLGLGLSERQVRTIINYRSTGARFDEPEDFRKIYGIDREMQDRLIPCIIIGETSRQARPDGSVRINNKTVEAGEDQRGGTVEKPDVYDAGADEDHSGGTVEKPDINSAGSDEDHSSWTVVRLDINHADSSDFEKLAGIGPVLAARIVKYRKLLGYFSGPSQLSEVYGLNTEVIAMHYPGFTCDSSLIRKININRASYADLLRHPYINRAQLEGILSYRRLSGPLTGIRELVRNRILDREEAERLKPYLDFE